MSPWESKGPTPAKDLGEGDRIDLSGTEPFLTDGNRQIVEYEYASVQQVNGGWADGMARPGDVVIYTHNLADPIILPADAIVHVERWH